MPFWPFLLALAGVARRLWSWNTRFLRWGRQNTIPLHFSDQKLSNEEANSRAVHSYRHADNTRSSHIFALFTRACRLWPLYCNNLEKAMKVDCQIETWQALILRSQRQPCRRGWFRAGMQCSVPMLLIFWELIFGHFYQLSDGRKCKNGDAEFPSSTLPFSIFVTELLAIGLPIEA